MWHPYMCVFCAVVGIVGCQNCPGLCLCPFGRLQVLSPSVLLHSMALLAFLSFLSEFSLPTHYVTHIHHNTTGLIAFVNVFYKKWYHLMKPCKCDTTNSKHAYLCILCTPLTDLDHWMVLTNSNISIIACPPSLVWPATTGQEAKVPLTAVWSVVVGKQARMDGSNLRASIQAHLSNSCLTYLLSKQPTKQGWMQAIQEQAYMDVYATHVWPMFQPVSMQCPWEKEMSEHEVWTASQPAASNSQGNDQTSDQGLVNKVQSILWQDKGS